MAVVCHVSTCYVIPGESTYRARVYQKLFPGVISYTLINRRVGKEVHVVPKATSHKSFEMRVISQMIKNRRRFQGLNVWSEVR